MKFENFLENARRNSKYQTSSYKDKARRSKAVFRWWKDHIDLLPDWCFEPTSKNAHQLNATYGSSFGNVNINIIWDFVEANRILEMFYEKGWTLVEGDDNPYRGTSTVQWKLCHPDQEECWAKNYYWDMNVRLKMEALSFEDATDEELSASDTHCYQIEIGEEEVVQTKKIYEVVCAGSARELREAVNKRKAELEAKKEAKPNESESES